MLRLASILCSKSITQALRTLKFCKSGLQVFFEEEKVNRQLRQDQGQSPEHSDEEFEATYTKQIQDARSALTDAVWRIVKDSQYVSEALRALI